MIVARLQDFKRYQALGRRVMTALDYLNSRDFSDYQPGEYAVEGKEIYAIINDYSLKPVAEGRLEGHRKYIDIQYLAQGSEMIGYVPYAGQEALSEYNAAGDYTFYAGDSSLVYLSQGMFAIFFPEDLHMPGIGDPKVRVRKVVMKIHI